MLITLDINNNNMASKEFLLKVYMYYQKLVLFYLHKTFRIYFFFKIRVNGTKYFKY